VRNLQTVTAAIELSAGLALLCAPSTALALLLGLPFEGSAAPTVARVAGAGLLALGVACAVARGDTQSRAARGLVAAMLLYNAIVATVLAFAGIGLQRYGVLLWPAVVIHAVMAVWCIASLRRRTSD
jgi:hypothetical protein